MRSVPCVAGCCGPMLRIMPLGLELDVHLRVGERPDAAMSSSSCSRSASVRSCVARLRRRLPSPSSSSLAGHRLDVDDAGPRLHHRARAAGSPCAAGGPRTRPAGRGGAGRDGRRRRCRTSPTPRARASRRRRRPAPTTATRRSSSGDVGLERDADVAACVDSTRANTWKRPSPPAYAVGRSRVGLRRRGRCRSDRPRRDRTATASSRCRRGSEVVAAELRRAALARRRRHASVRDPHPRGRRRTRWRARRRASPSSACERARAVAAAAVVAVQRRVASARRRVVGASRQPTTIGSRPVASRCAPCPRSGCAAAAARCPRAAPPGRGGQPGT